jgi:hypothetical protein
MDPSSTPRRLVSNRWLVLVLLGASGACARSSEQEARNPDAPSGGAAPTSAGGGGGSLIASGGITGGNAEAAAGGPGAGMCPKSCPDGEVRVRTEGACRCEPTPCGGLALTCDCAIALCETKRLGLCEIEEGPSIHCFNAGAP